MPDFIEVWYGSPSSQDTLKWRIHLPFDLEWYFLYLRFMSGLMCANIVNGSFLVLFFFLKSSVVNRIGLFLIILSISLLNIYYQASLFSWSLSEWGGVIKFSLLPWIPETPSSLVIRQLLQLSRDLPFPCLSLFIQFLPIALRKIEEIHLCIRNIFNDSKELS